MSPDVRLRALADAGRQDPGAPTVGRVVTPPHRKSEKDAPDWYEEMYERQRKVPSSHHIRVEHSIACPKIGSVYCGVMRASDGSIEWLEDFITAWHGPRQPSYGLTETELPAFLPAPLQRLYRHAGRWPGPNPEEHLPDSPGIFQQQDVLVPAEALSLHDGTVEFLSENQDSWTCRVTAAAPAAPVVLSNAHWMWDDGPEDEYTPLTPSLEQFLTSFVLQETVFGCRNLATADEPTALPDRSVPLWLDGWYVFEEPSHSFWSVDSTLVADISGTRWVGWNGPDTPSAELGKLQTIRSWCRDRQCLPRKERRPVRAIARRPEALVAELLGLLANAASVRAGRRDGAKLAGRGTSVLRESAPSQDPDHTRANTASRALEPFVSAVQQRIDSAPPADEESSRVVLSEGAGLLLDARKGRLTRQVTCQAPSMAHSQTTIRTVPRVSLELGVVAEEDLDALSGSARALGRVELRGQPERDAGAAQVVRAVRRLKDVLVKGGSGVTRSSPRRCRTPQHRCGPVFKGARGAASTKPAGRSYPLSRTLS